MINQGQNARLGMLSGADKLADIVAVTLGPMGRTVLIDMDGNKPPCSTKNGARIADSLSNSDPLEQVGLRLVRRAGQRIKEDLGDGATTTIVLARALVFHGIQALLAGMEPRRLSVLLEEGISTVIGEIRRMAKRIDGQRDYENVAAIAANGEVDLGRIVVEAYNRVGVNGLVSVERSQGSTSSVVEVIGINWEGGYISPYFMTDPTTTVCDYENPLILLYEQSLDRPEAILQPLELAKKIRRPLLIVAETVKGEALRFLTLNKIRNGVPVVAGKAPFFGDRRRQKLEDVAALTGAQVISPQFGGSQKSIDTKALGSAKKIRLTKNQTTIVGGEGKGDPITRRIQGINAQLRGKSLTPYDQCFLEERLAALTGGIAIIQIGGDGEVEIRERVERAESAVKSVILARKSGVVPGGGTAYIQAINALPISHATEKRIVFGLLRKALSEPTRRIALNGGFDGTAIAARLREIKREPFIGFDGRSGEICDLYSAGVLDPAEIVITALQAAASVASLFLMTEVVVAKDKVIPRATRSTDIPFGPEAKDMTAEEASSFGLV